VVIIAVVIAITIAIVIDRTGTQGASIHFLRDDRGGYQQGCGGGKDLQSMHGILPCW
jgi:hypothetical protein